MAVKKTTTKAKPKTSTAKPPRSVKKTVASRPTGTKPKPASRARTATTSRSVTAKKSVRKSTVAVKRKRSPKKKRTLTRPFVFALLTVLLVGFGSMYILLSGSLKPDNTVVVADAGKLKGKPEVALPKVEPAVPVKETKKTKPKQEDSVVPKVSIPSLDVTIKDVGSSQADAGVPHTRQSNKSAQSSGTLKDIGDVQLKGGEQAGAQEFETTLGTALEHSTKLIDSTLLHILKNRGLDVANIKILDVERRSRQVDSYYFQKLQLNIPQDSRYGKNPSEFGLDLSAALPSLLIGADLAGSSDIHYVISVDGLITHEIFLNIFSTLPTGPIVSPPPGEARLAIVIDDVGESITAAKTLANLDFPVSMAIWPRAGFARQCAELGHERGLEIMIHQPMEPMEYPKVKPGPGAIFNKMSAVEITAVVRENIPLVPYAVGLNNHMGSRFTQNRQGLEAVFAALQGKNLFVLDSVTHGGTIFYNLAIEKGFPSQRRDIFLDVTRDKNAILHQLYKSERLAHTQGYAIAIGHPLPETLAALQEWQKSRDKSVKIVRVQDLLKYKRENGTNK